MAMVKRMVIKIGSSTVMGQDGARKPWLVALAADVKACHAKGQQVVIVSSGAVAMGRLYAPAYLKDGEGLERKQALAACGQFLLMNAYHEAFATVGIAVAQLLLTPQDSDRRANFLNATATLEELLSAGVVPVVNENDTVATEDMRVGDNDRLAARVAAMAGADRLVILSDIDGLYDRSPSKPDAVHIPLVERITPEIEAYAGGAGSQLGTGGMATKLQAARMAMQAGCDVIIMKGQENAPLKRLEAGERHTRFMAEGTVLNAHKRWLGGQLHVKGSLWLDEGAVQALKSGKSLLPVGVVKVEGRFDRGEAVRLMAPDGRELGRGLINYQSEEASRICRMRVEDVTAALGYPARKAMVQRDYMVLAAF
jgi:glutamate 5-kinase